MDNNSEYITPDMLDGETAGNRLEIHKMIDEITDAYAIKSIWWTTSRFYWLEADRAKRGVPKGKDKGSKVRQHKR